MDRKGFGKSRGKYDISIYNISKYDRSICMCMVCMLSQLFNKRSKTGGSKGKRSSLIHFYNSKKGFTNFVHKYVNRQLKAWHTYVHIPKISTMIKARDFKFDMKVYI